jgi:hypothetical protein
MATISERTVFGFKKTIVDGVVYASIYVGFQTDETDHAEGMGGYQITRMSCDPHVCDALDPRAAYPINVRLSVRQKIKSGTMTEFALKVLPDASSPAPAPKKTA